MGSPRGTEKGGDAMASNAIHVPAGSISLEHRTTKTVEPGSPFPLGATPGADGVNFAIYSKHATEVFLLLFDTADGQPSDVIQLRDRDKLIWHTRVKGLRAGQLYGYKVRGVEQQQEYLRGMFRVDGEVHAIRPRRRAQRKRRAWLHCFRGTVFQTDASCWYMDCV